MHARRILVLILLVGAVIAVTGCSLSLPQGDSGSIALMPFWEEESGIQGVTPRQGWTDVAELVQGSVPGTMDDAVAIVLEQTSLTELPPPTGTYRGKGFSWGLYAAELQVHEVGSQTMHVDLGLAEDETAAYLVALIVLPDAYESNPPLYDTVFFHALYALEPLE